MEELRLILETLKVLGPEAKQAFYLWLIMDKGPMLLFAPFAGYCLVVMSKALGKMVQNIIE